MRIEGEGERQGEGRVGGGAGETGRNLVAIRISPPLCRTYLPGAAVYEHTHRPVPLREFVKVGRRGPRFPLEFDNSSSRNPRSELIFFLSKV